MSIVLFRIILPVTDIEKACRFYQHVLESPGERVSSGRHYFDCGSTLLACYDPVADGDTEHSWRYHPHQYLYFSVADLEACYQRIARLSPPSLGQILEQPWGERLFYLTDPWQNQLSFVDRQSCFTGKVKSTC